MNDLILTRVDKARSLLERASTVTEAKKVADMAKAAEVYAKRQKLSEEAIQYATTIKIDAMALMGQFLKTAPKNSGTAGAGRPNLGGQRGVPPKQPPTLASVGISKNDSSTGQFLAELKTNRPSRFNSVRIGEITITEAKRLLRREAIDEKLEFSRKAPRKSHSEGPFQLILADPPWRYEHCESNNREIENQYPTASLDEIKAMAPSSAPDSILFLWATAPKLSESLAVMLAWGFNYRSCAVWDKGKIGMGYWWRIQHELLLVGTKGKPGCTPEPERVPSIFQETRTAHSQKPEAVYLWLERAFPGLSKLEMFARRSRPGWAIHGNQV